MAFSLTLRAQFAGFCASLLFAPASLLAQQAEPQQVLGLQDAVIRSLQNNPDLKAFAYELQAQQGRVRQAGARPNPEVSVLVENALGSGTRSGFDAAETTISLGFLIEHGARQGRLAAAQAGNNLLDTETTVRRLDLAAETTRRYLAILTAQEELGELNRSVQLAEETLAAVQARVRAAKAPQAEQARAHVQVARLELDQEHGEHQLITAKQRLAALWGARQPDFDSVQGALLNLPKLEAYERFAERTERNPQFAMLLSEQRLREADVRLAEARRRPPWQVTAGVRRFEDHGDHAVIVGLSVPLPVRDQTQGALATARAQAAQVNARRDAFRAQLDAELFAIYQELKHSYKEAEVLRNDVLPRMEVAVEQSRYAYERGRYGYIEWVAAQRELLDQRRALLEAAANVHRFRIEIERLTGAAFSGGL